MTRKMVDNDRFDNAFLESPFGSIFGPSSIFLFW